MKSLALFMENIGGDPKTFVFKGQYYDAGEQSITECGGCGKFIRFCYILKSPADRSLTIGSECFKFFSNKTQLQLKAARTLLQATTDAIAVASLETEFRTTRGKTRAEWRKAKRQAMERIRKYRIDSGKEWLPENLYNLQMALDAPEPQFKKPQSYTRWYKDKIKQLTEA